MPHFIPSRDLLTNLGSCPGDVTIAQHLAVVAQLLSELAVDDNALAKPSESGGWGREFRARIVEIQDEHSLDPLNVLHLLGAVLADVTRFLDHHGR